MSSGFDPYYKWLGIPPRDQPPHHYRLLAIELYEADRQVIEAAAERVMTYLKVAAGGEEVEHSQRLLNEVAAARRCLLDAQKKAAYDASLRAKQAAAIAPPPPPPAAPLAAPPAQPAPPPAGNAPAEDGLAALGALLEETAAVPRGPRKPPARSKGRARPAAHEKSPPDQVSRGRIPTWVLATAGLGVTAVVLLAATIGVLLFRHGDHPPSSSVAADPAPQEPLAAAAPQPEHGPAPLAADLESGFRNPPAGARPWANWKWIDGTLTAGGITADLEHFERLGIGGVLIEETTQKDVHGPARFLSPAWKTLFQQALAEAARRKIAVGLALGPGSAGSGGPWITPELAMQEVAYTERVLQGAHHFAGQLDAPPAAVGAYHDVAVLARPAVAGEEPAGSEIRPSVGGTIPRQTEKNYAQLVDGKLETGINIPTPIDSRHPPCLTYTFPKPFTVRSIYIRLRWAHRDFQVKLQISRDGRWRNRTEVGTFNCVSPGGYLCVDKPPTGQHFCLEILSKDSAKGYIPLAEARLDGAYHLDDGLSKAGFARGVNTIPVLQPVVESDHVVPKDRILDLADRCDAQGRLNWDVPNGNWVVLRIGYRPSGAKTADAPAEGEGLECDRLAPDGVATQVAKYIDPLLAAQADLPHRPIVALAADLWKSGVPNWSRAFYQEFQARRGYDPRPWLFALTGRGVERLELSERFLWDFRRTLADLAHAHFAAQLHALAKQRNLELFVSGDGGGIFDNVTFAGRGDVPLAALRDDAQNSVRCRTMASAAHVYGRTVAAAKAFAANPGGPSPIALKVAADTGLCEGINRLLLLRTAQQPWSEAAAPLSIEPPDASKSATATWWDYGPPGVAYLARCQYLLAQGRPVADVCYIIGEGAPNDPVPAAKLDPPPPAGYDYDYCPAELVQSDMTVRDGEVHLSCGAHYRVLVLPPEHRITPELLRKIQALVADGATVYGHKPTASPSLTNYPACDEEVRKLAAELWAECDGKKNTSHRVGRGQMVDGKSLAAVLAEAGRGPDFTAHGIQGQSLRTIHRTTEDVDIYFLARPSLLPNETGADAATNIACTFRAARQRAEIWHPDSGRIEPAVPVDPPPAGTQPAGTQLRVPFDRSGSVFVVLRKK